MGYERVFKPTKEAVDKKLTGFNFCGRDYKEQLEEYKKSLAVYCMQDQTDFNKIHEVICNIKTYLGLIKSTVLNIQKEATKKEYDTSVDQTFYFSGWQYKEKMSDINIDYYFERLLILATLVKTSDYFDNSELFADKLLDINDRINDYINDCYDEAVWQIIDDFKEFELLEEDDDLVTYNNIENESDKTQEE